MSMYHKIKTNNFREATAVYDSLFFEAVLTRSPRIFFHRSPIPRENGRVFSPPIGYGDLLSGRD